MKHQNNFQIVPYKDSYRDQITSVWERSVLATHQFLSKEDFFQIKDFVRTIDFNSLDIFGLSDELELIGFIGISDNKIEMLFLLPEYFGQGFGKQLIQFAISELNADKVDVNEQNVSATEFYKKMGFTVYDRNEKDDLGKDYPILKMKILQDIINEC